MAKEINLAFPDETTPGILGFYRKLPTVTEKINQWAKVIEDGALPKPEEIDAIVDLILFFAVNEQDKEGARKAILDNWNAVQVASALKSIEALTGKAE
jgi:hypothetical protein